MKYEFNAQLDPVQRPAFDHGPIKKNPEVPESLPPLIKALVLAYQIKRAIGDGQFTDYADAARQLELSRARISQLMKLTKLAAAIQEVIINRPEKNSHLTERSIRRCAKIANLGQQQILFESMLQVTN